MQTRDADALPERNRSGLPVVIAGRAPFRELAHLLEDPRVALGTAGDASSVSTRLFETIEHGSRVHEIATREDGNLHGLLHAGNHTPICLVMIEIT